MRNLDVKDNNKGMYKGIKGDNTYYINFSKVGESVVIEDKDNKVIGAVYSRKKIVGDGEFSYSIEKYGDDKLIEPFLSEDKGVYNKDDNSCEYCDIVFKEVKNVDMPYKVSKLKGISYHKLETNNVNMSESYKESLLETLPIEAVEGNYKLKKVGSKYVKEYEDSNGKKYNFSWILNKNYRIITKRDEIIEYIKGLDLTEDIVGFDTETTGLRANRFHTDKLVGICMSYEDDGGVYFPISHKKYDNIEMDKKEFLELLKPYFDRNSPKKKKTVLHNAKFDWKVMKMYGWDLEITHDTYIMQGLMKIESAKGVASLKGMATNMLGYDTLDLSDIFYKLTPADKKSDILDFSYMSYDLSRLYCGADGDLPRIILRKMLEEWDSELDFIYTLELECIRPTATQEYYGIRVDLDLIEELKVNTLKELEDTEKKIYELVGKEFNMNSSKVKSEILYNDIGVPKLARFKTKTGYGTGKAALEYFDSLEDNGKKRFPVASLMDKHSKLSQKLSLFYNKIPVMAINGYIFPQYNQLGTESGRFSSNSPNLQQTERDARKALKPDSDDYYFLICDYSQVEYRLSAGLNKEKSVVDFFSSNPEADYHILAYANMKGKEYHEVTSKERKLGKILNFAISYGLQDQNLAIKLFGNDDQVHQRMAAKQRDEYFSGVPNIRDNMRRVELKAMKDGYVKTLFNRRRHIKEFEDVKNAAEYELASGSRKASNTYVQGTAADIMKQAIVRCHHKFQDELGYDIRIVLNVHDELCFQVPKHLNMWYIIKLVRECMEMDLSHFGIPPLYVGANVGYSWYDGKVDELEAPVLLMDKKGAEIDEMLKSGVSVEDLAYSEDPRGVFYEDIREFMCEVISEEIKNNNYTTLDECHKSQRLMSYSGKYMEDNKESGGKNINLIFQETIDNQYSGKELYSKLREIEQGKEIKYEPKVIEKEDLTDEELEIREDDSNVVRKVLKMLEVDNKNKELLIKLPKFNSSAVLKILDLLVVRETFNLFKDGSKFYSVKMEVEGERINLYGKHFPVFFSKVLQKILTEYYIFGEDGDYGKFDELIDTVGTENLKEGLELKD